MLWSDSVELANFANILAVVTSVAGITDVDVIPAVFVVSLVPDVLTVAGLHVVVASPLVLLAFLLLLSSPAVAGVLAFPSSGGVSPCISLKIKKDITSIK